MIAKYKGQPIKPYETFNWDDSRKFAKPSMGGGYSYTLKCHCHLAIMEVIYEDNGQIQLSDTL